MKKFVKLLPLALVSGLILTAGCRQAEYTVTTKPNWYTNTAYDGVQNAGSEVLRYKVTYRADENSNVTFGEDSTLVTTFGSATLAEATKNSPYTYSAAGTTGVYKWQAVQTIHVTVNGTAYTDTVEDVVYFRSHRDTLAPIYSQRTVDTHSVFAAEVKELKETYTTYYREDLKLAATKTLDGTTTEVKFKTDYPLFDNAQLFAVLRANTFLAGNSQSCEAFIPADKSADTSKLVVSFNSTNEAKADSEDADQKAVYAAAKAFFTDLGESLSYNSVSIGKTGTLFTGQKQTVWIASVTGANSNTYHSIPLRYSVPAPYGSGTMVYNLSAIDSVFSK